jgi:hypothetical protein
MVNINYAKHKIPIWINILSGIVVLILLFQMYACYYDPGLAYGTFENTFSNRQVILTLAGRNFAMVILILFALKSQHAALIHLTFLMNFARELYDMILVGYLNDFSGKGIGMMLTFLVFLVPYIFALKKLRQLASKSE